MPIICWGNLAKSADDTKRIEQAISEYVEDHNFNPNAHQVEGSSLYMHRVNETLDHLFGSVSLKHLVMDQILGFTLFESLDGWTIYGNADPGIFSARIYTDDSSGGNSAGIASYSWVGGPGFNPNKNPAFQATVKMESSTYVRAYIIAGWYPIEGTGDSFGFKIVNATEYAYWTRSGVEYTQELTDISSTQVNVYRAYMDSTAGKIYFYVNGVLKYVATSNLPNTSSECFGSFFIERTGNSARAMRIVDWFYEQDR